MLPEESRGRQEKLDELIYELSKELLTNDNKRIKQILNRLDIIYGENFKHKYSDLFPIIVEVFKEDNQYNSDYLSNNLDKLGTYLESEYSKGNKDYSGMHAQFTKLCDHLNLQMGQLSYILSKGTSDTILQEAKEVLDTSNEQIKKSLIKLDESNKNLEKSEQDLKETSRKADAMQTELIAILGIFAAIIIAFSGGMTLLGSNITSISNAKHYESVIMVAIICGMVMFNTIFLMMYFVSKLTEKDIMAKCEAEVCVECKNEECKGLTRIRKRFPYVFYYNCMSIIGIALDLAVWLMDIKGFLG